MVSILHRTTGTATLFTVLNENSQCTFLYCPPQNGPHGLVDAGDGGLRGTAFSRRLAAEMSQRDVDLIGAAGNQATRLLVCCAHRIVSLFPTLLWACYCIPPLFVVPSDPPFSETTVRRYVTAQSR
jgi:hypothetical protein